MDYAEWRKQVAREWKELERHGTPFLQAAFWRGVANRLDGMGLPAEAKKARDKARDIMTEKPLDADPVRPQIDG